MDAVEVHSAAEVERLSPDERQRLVDDNTSTDLSRVSAEFVARARAEGRRLLMERGLDHGVTERRAVRVTDAVFRQLDIDLPSERGPDGEPSTTDFIVLELPTIVERFATDFEGLPEIVEGVPAARMLIASGVLVRAVAVFGIVTSDTTIDLVGLTIEPCRGPATETRRRTAG